jgi:hypothetical protein
MLVSLNLAWCDQMLDSALTGLPDSIKTLNLDHCFCLTDDSLKQLPSSLLDLNVSYQFDLTGKKVGFELTFVGIGFKHLPSSLLHLNASHCRAVANDSLANLPSLTNLEIQCCSDVTADILPHLPSTLKSLDLGLCRITTLKQFSCQLLSLDLSGATVPDEEYQYLPATLTTLNLSKSSITSNGIQQLPRGLRVLKLKECTGISDDASLFLFSRLEFLDLSYTCTSDKVVELLPVQNLRVLSLSHTNVTGTAFKHLPKTIQKLEVVTSPFILEPGNLFLLPNTLAHLVLSHHLFQPEFGALSSELFQMHLPLTFIELEFGVLEELPDQNL